MDKKMHEFLCEKAMLKQGFECPVCGNHVCEGCAKSWGGLCPNCFSKLYRIS